MSAYAKYTALSLGGNINGAGAANQVAVFSGANTIGGSASLTFNGSTLALTGSQTISSLLAVTTGIGIGSGVGDANNLLYAQSNQNGATILRVANTSAGASAVVRNTMTTDLGDFTIAAGGSGTTLRGSITLDAAFTGGLYITALGTNPLSIRTNNIERIGITGAGVVNISNLTASTVPYSDASKNLVSSTVTPTELGYVSGVTSAIQTQLNTKAPSTSPTFDTSATFSYATLSTVPYFDASKNLISSSVTPTELGYLSGVTSALQTQLNLKAPLASPTFTGTVGAAAVTATGKLTLSLARASTYQANYHDITGNVRLATSTIIGSSGSGYPFVGYNARATSTTNNYEYDSNDYASILQFGTGAASGFYFKQGPSGTAGNTISDVLVGSCSSAGLWTLGASGGTQAHVINGSITISSTTDATSNTAGGAETNSGGLAVAKKAFIGTGLAVGSALNPGGSAGVYASVMNATTGFSGLDLGATGDVGAGGNLSAIKFWNNGGRIGQIFLEAGSANNTGKMTITTAKAGTLTSAVTITENQSVIIGAAAIATNATDGFLYIPSCAGTPTGVPSANTGRVAMVYDTTNNKFYVYNGAWKSVTLA